MNIILHYKRFLFLGLGFLLALALLYYYKVNYNPSGNSEADPEPLAHEKSTTVDTAKINVPYTEAVQPVPAPPPLTTVQAERIAILKKQVLVTFDEIKVDELKQFRQSSAMWELAAMQRPESIEALVSLFYAEPQSAYFVSTRDWKTLSHHSMFNLSKVLEDIPLPLNGATYETGDILRFREWWEANRSNLRFKKLPDPAK